MKLTLHVELPEVEVETDSGHGSIDSVWLDGEDICEWPVHKLIMEFLGEAEWREALVKAEAASGAARIGWRQ